MEGASIDAQAVVEVAKAITGSGNVWASALLIIGLGLLVAQRFGLLTWLFNRTPVQAETFQDKLLAALTASQAREDILMAKLDASSARYDELREEAQKSRFETMMLREQLRMLLIGVKRVLAGEMKIESLPLPELPERP